MLLMLRPDLADARFVTNPLTDAIARYRAWFFLLLALLYLISFNGQWRIGHDSAIYRGLGANVAAGRGYVFGDWATHQAYPGLPYLLAGVQRLCGVTDLAPLRAQGAFAFVSPRIDTTVSLLVILAMAAATLVLTYRLIRLHYPVWIATCITFGLGSNSWFLELSHSLLTDVPFLLGLVAALYGWELLKRATAWRGRVVALTLIVPGLALAGSMRPMFWVVGLAWTLVCLWALVRGERRRFHAVSLVVLLAVWAVLVVFDPRHPRGFHPFAGGYEREFLELLPDVPRTIGQRISQALDEELPAAFFGEQMRPVSAIASLLVLASSALLFRRHPLWACIVFIAFAVTLLASAEARYYVMLLPMMLLGWLLLFSAIARRLPTTWGTVVLGLGLTIVTANNLTANVGFIREQRATPFVQEYDHGKYVKVLQMADLVRARVDDRERVLAPLAPIMRYVSGKQVLSQREVLPRGNILLYPQALLEARLNYAVFPASAYRVKEPILARLIERNILFSIKRMGIVNGWTLGRVRVRIPPGDWRDLPRGWKPPRPRTAAPVRPPTVHASVVVEIPCDQTEQMTSRRCLTASTSALGKV